MTAKEVHVGKGAPRLKVYDGSLWVDTSAGGKVRVFDGGSWREAAEEMERLRETTVEARCRTEQLGYEFTRALLRPHDVRMRNGFWFCGRCGAEAWDVELIRELECDGD